MRAALEFKNQINTLVLLEPNPFFLFNKENQPIEYLESRKFGQTIRLHKEKKDWEGFG